MTLGAFVPDMQIVLLALIAAAVGGFIAISVQTVSRLNVKFARDIAETERACATIRDLIQKRVREIGELEGRCAEVDNRHKKLVAEADQLHGALERNEVPFRFTVAVFDHPRHERELPFYFSVRADHLGRRDAPGSQAKVWLRGRRYLSYGLDMKLALIKLEERFPRQQGFLVLPE